MMQKLPLFPLNIVLFPGAALTLHIFEERYKLMIARCLEQNIPFGVVLIRKGEEISGSTIPYNIGTIAQINANVKMEDGRYYIATAGQRRFRIQYALQRVPYMIASVVLLSEEGSTEAILGAQELRNMYTTYWRAITAATGFQTKMEQLPQDIVSMSYQLADRMQVPNERKQRWLEADVATRVREITAILRSELLILPKLDPNTSSEGWNGPGSWN